MADRTPRRSGRFTVECDDHGPMTYDGCRYEWRCLTPGCKGWIPDYDVQLLVLSAPDHAPDPLLIVVI